MSYPVALFPSHRTGSKIFQSIFDKIAVSETEKNSAQTAESFLSVNTGIFPLLPTESPNTLAISLVLM